MNILLFYYNIALNFFKPVFRQSCWFPHSIIGLYVKCCVWSHSNYWFKNLILHISYLLGRYTYIMMDHQRQDWPLLVVIYFAFIYRIHIGMYSQYLHEISILLLLHWNILLWSWLVSFKINLDWLSPTQ